MLLRTNGPSSAPFSPRKYTRSVVSYGLFFQYGVDAIAIIALKGIEMFCKFIQHHRFMVAETRANARHEHRSNARTTRSADGVFAEPIEFFVSLLQIVSSIEAEDDDGIATVLAVQLVDTRGLQQPIRFLERKLHCER